jgi:hypothetical protein
VADPTILCGFTSNVPKASRSGFFFGIGTPPVTIYLSSLGSPPFDSDDYIAVAIRRGLLIPGNVALAYRLVGQKCAAEAAGLASAVTFILLGVMGAINLLRFPHANASFELMSYFGIVLGALNTYRVREILRAKRLLNEWEPSAPP